MEQSIWQEEIRLPEFPSLKSDRKTHTLIIGGGLCGLLCAYCLKQAGIDCVVVESDRIAQGTSGNTTAKATVLHGLIYHRLAEKSGLEAAKQYYQIQQTALDALARIAREADCDWQWMRAYTYSLDDGEKLQREYGTLKAIGAPAQWQTQTPLPFAVAGAVGLPHQAVFHPLKLISHILPDLEIYENTRVTGIAQGCACTPGGRIHAEKIIVASHFPIFNRHGLYFLKLYQHRSYVLALENAPTPDGMYVDEKSTGLSFRSCGDLLLLGGAGARTGKPCGGWDTLEKCRQTYYPGSTVKCRWATQDCMSLDKLPLIGQYAAGTPDLLVATGFNKWGMTNSMAAALLLTDRIRGIENPASKLFDPSRSILKPQLFVNCVESVSNLLRFGQKRCPHLGCALKWNPREHSWDCACHGSRFRQDGKLLNNPANKDLDG